MVNIHCGPDGSCPYEYECINNLCEHVPVFPISGYPIALYCFFPFASAICNTSGNSFGQFKVLLLMDALDYSESAATTLAYPMVLGTALYNFINLIMRRHPSKNTSLVDYNIVMIIIPNVLYGSTIGSLINNFIPPIVADCLIIVLLSLFSVKFFLKVKALIKKEKYEQTNIRSTNQLPLLNGEDAQRSIIQKQPEQSLSLPRLSQSAKEITEDKIMENPCQEELNTQLQYEAGYHFTHILTILLLFAVFEFCSFLAQGKIVEFGFCTKWYAIGISLLTVFYVAVVLGVFFFTRTKMRHYQRIGYEYDYPLDKIKFFALICLGSFLGGFNGGVFALGNSTTIIFTLVYLQVEPIVTSATVGFQVVFAAAASLCQALVKDTIPLNVVGFFFVITFVGGGILSYIAGYFIGKLNRTKVNKILMMIVGTLTGVSALSMVFNIVLGYVNFGAEYMISIDNIC